VKSPILISSLSMLLLILGVSLGAQQLQSGISVKYQSSEIEISVTRTTSLRMVLDVICRETHMSCEGLEQVEGIHVAPLRLHGPKDKAIAELIEGSGLNYVLTEPSGDRAGSLLLQLPPTGPESLRAAALPNTGAEAKDVSNSAMPVVPESEVASGFDSAASHEALVQRTDAAKDGGHASGAVAEAGGAAGTRSSPLTSEVPEGNYSQSAGPQYLPFPDSQGHLIPAQSSGVSEFPFPDSHGNQIVLDSSQEPGSPFPNEAIQQANGRPH
jgi:hypothetical protein